MFTKQAKKMERVITKTLSSRDGFRGKRISKYFNKTTSSQYRLNLDTLSRRLPALDNKEPSEAENFISDNVFSYSRGNIFQKIWWRLTKPIGLYFQIYNVLTLSQLSKALENNLPGQAKSIYQNSALPSLVNFWDKLRRSWRSFLGRFFSKVNSDLNNNHQETSSSKEIIKALSNKPENPDNNFTLAQTVPSTSNTSYLKHKERLLQLLKNQKSNHKEIVECYQSLTQYALDSLKQTALIKPAEELEKQRQTLKVELKRLYRKVCLRVYPDKNPSQKALATETSKRINYLQKTFESKLDTIVSFFGDSPNLSDSKELGEYLAKRDRLEREFSIQVNQLVTDVYEIKRGIVSLNETLDKNDEMIDETRKDMNELNKKMKRFDKAREKFDKAEEKFDKAEEKFDKEWEKLKKVQKKFNKGMNELDYLIDKMNRSSDTLDELDKENKGPGQPPTSFDEPDESKSPSLF